MTSVLSDSMLIVAAEGGHPVVNELPFAPIWFGVIALVIAAALLAFLWSFRNTLALDPHAPEHGTGTGTTTPEGRRGSTTP